MDKHEMSNEFDILYNQVNSNQAPGLDEYEKSVFLTKSQDEIVKAYFDPRGNKFLEGFDDGLKRQYDFSSLVENKTLTNIDISLIQNFNQYDPRSYVYFMPEELFLTLNESIVETYQGNQYIYQILPISYQQYNVLMQKPYQYPPKRSVWRIITGFTETGFGSKDTGSYCEIIGRFKNNNSAQLSYKMRYVKKPTPIILVDLTTGFSGLTIDNHTGHYSSDTAADPDGGISCKLPEGVHHEIVQRAVELATAIYNPQALSSMIGVGNASATNLGIVPRLENK